MKLFLNFFRRNKKKTDIKEKSRGDENTLFIGGASPADNEEVNVLGSKEISSGKRKTTPAPCKDSYYRKDKSREKHSILWPFLAFVLIPLSAHVILDEEGIAKAKGFFQLSTERLKERVVSNRETVTPSTNVDDVAQEATVKVLSLDKDAAAVSTEGSGTLIRCTDGSCQVLTNAHVINGNSTLRIVTHDGQQYEGTVAETYGSNSSPDDVGLIEFKSEVAYTGIPLSSSDPVKEEEVTAAGYLFGSDKISMLDGNLTAILSEPLEKGYRLGYSIDIKQGMSGGPLINREGKLIGINGKRSHPVSIFGDTRYLFKDGREVSELPLQELNEYSWAIPTETLQRFL